MLLIEYNYKPENINNIRKLTQKFPLSLFVIKIQQFSLTAERNRITSDIIEYYFGPLPVIINCLIYNSANLTRRTIFNKLKQHCLCDIVKYREKI